MTDMASAIMDSAERRMRLGGFGGFSFRDIATDVGIKSSSVHYHFPTKEALTAAVIHRYTDRVSEKLDREIEETKDPMKVFTRAFRGTLHSGARMCPATVLGAGALDLPQEVAAEVKRFFKMCLTKMQAHGVSAAEASEHLATITGAMVLAISMQDLSAYDRSTGEAAGGAKPKKARKKA
jgi:TetR/AcrR family transcriptional repressor of nem operon